MRVSRSPRLTLGGDWSTGFTSHPLHSKPLQAPLCGLPSILLPRLQSSQIQLAHERIPVVLIDDLQPRIPSAASVEENAGERGGGKHKE